MVERLTILGFGEAGGSFAVAAAWGDGARAFDISPVGYAGTGVVGCASLAEAVSGTPAILSVVTADAALAVAREAATHIEAGSFFFDMNSVSPGTKQQAAEAIEAAGGCYVDTAIMAPVNPQRLAVPLLISGRHAVVGGERLASLGFTNIRIVGDDVGRASTIKMLRSVMYKGVEALTAECLLACEKAGVSDEVLGSFGNDWSSGADYRLDRMMVHGERRAAEMLEAAKTLSELGIEPLMTRGTALRQAQLGAMGVKQPPEGLRAKLERLKA